ncbi:unnamed protein product [Arabidopsis halleri]
MVAMLTCEREWPSFFFFFFLLIKGKSLGLRGAQD